MTSLFGPVYVADVRALPRHLRLRAAAMVREIEVNPKPDGVFKRVAPAPFKPGTVVAMAHGLAVRYAIEPEGLRFHRVQRVGP